MQQVASGGRLYGLDWLRIGAFGLLILYHIGMFFVPWGWHVKTAEPLEWLELPMMALNPWRLTLLFLISGIASRALLAKTDGAGAFARGRSLRLLVPLAAGMILFVAPQPWAELREKAGYGAGFLHFWTHDYLAFAAREGIVLPTWNHLWFVAYLWVYTMALALLSLLPAAVRAGLQRGFERAFAGWRLLVLPMLWLAGLRLFLFPLFEETHALLDDPYAHAVYGSAFFFGVGLARADRPWSWIVAHWRTAAVAGVAAYGLIVLLDLGIDGESGEIELAVRRIARSVQAWGIVVALIGFAVVKLHRDGPVRRYLTDAIFPFYIAHQTIIVLVGHGLKPLGLGAGAEFAIILATTVAGCALAYEVGRRIRLLRPLIGLKAYAGASSRMTPSSAAATR